MRMALVMAEFALAGALTGLIVDLVSVKKNSHFICGSARNGFSGKVFGFLQWNGRVEHNVSDLCDQMTV